MAIDKSRTKPWMKVVIVFIIISFVIGVAPFIADMLNAPTVATTNAPLGAGGQVTSQTIDAINLKYTPTIKSREASLAAEPKSYELNVLQGNSYFDWAAELSQTTNGQQGNELWASAASFYAAALQAKPGDPNVTTDYAIATFYSGDTAKAITIAEQLTASDATFSPVWFNLGIFYEQSGDKAKAKTAYEKYLAMDPTGSSAQAAKDGLGRVK